MNSLNVNIIDSIGDCKIYRKDRYDFINRVDDIFISTLLGKDYILIENSKFITIKNIKTNLLGLLDNNMNKILDTIYRDITILSEKLLVCETKGGDKLIYDMRSLTFKGDYLELVTSKNKNHIFTFIDYNGDIKVYNSIFEKFITYHTGRILEKITNSQISTVSDIVRIDIKNISSLLEKGIIKVDDVIVSINIKDFGLNLELDIHNISNDSFEKYIILQDGSYLDDN